MSDKKYASKKEILETLFGDSKKMVLLFPDNVVLKQFSTVIGQDIRNEPKIISGTKFKVASNLIRVGDSIVFLGLNKDEPLLSESYEDIRYYNAED